MSKKQKIYSIQHLIERPVVITDKLSDSLNKELDFDIYLLLDESKPCYFTNKNSSNFWINQEQTILIFGDVNKFIREILKRGYFICIISKQTRQEILKGMKLEDYLSDSPKDVVEPLFYSEDEEQRKIYEEGANIVFDSLTDLAKQIYYPLYPNQIKDYFKV